MSETPQDFDFDAWLDDASRPEHGVTVYQKAGLIADLDRLAEQITNADETEDVDGPSMAGGTGLLREEYAKLAQQFHDSALTIRVQGLNEDEQIEIRKAHADLEASDLGRVVIAEAITYPRVTPAQVKKLEKAIGDAQFGKILAAYYKACKEIPTVSADFLPKPSTRDDGGE